MENIDKAIEILQAYKEGKTIEYYVNYTDSWEEVKPNEDIISKIYKYSDLRIKHTPKLRPYANAEEFLKDSKEHGPYVKPSDAPNFFLIPAFISDTSFCTALNCRCNYNSLLNNYKWQDGSPCGIFK